MAFKYPGIRQLIVRQTYPELEKNHIQQLCKELVPQFAKYNGSKKQIVFPNGSIIDFQYCNNDAALNRLQGSEYHIIYIDEASNLTEYQIKAIFACNRAADDYPKRCYLTMNPGGSSHSFLKRLFITKNYEVGEDPEDYSFTQALVTDNKILMEHDESYIKHLEALPPKLREAWLYGSWDIFEGQFFEDFIDNPEHYDDRQWTHVIEPFDIPPGWTIYRSFDFGYSKPFSFGYYAIDYEGVAYRILDFYGCTGTANEGVKWAPDKIFSEARKLEDTHPWLKGKKIHGVADPAIWNKSTGESIEETASKYRIYFDKGTNDRIPGWMQCHYRLQFDENGYPMMYVFKNCKHFIRTIPLMMYDETHVEDIDTDLEDHIADEWRYFCMARPIKPRLNEVNKEIGDDPLNQRVPKRKSIYVRR